MKFLLLALAASASQAIYLSPCQNYERGRVSFSYQACVNNNFSQISTELRTYPSYCSNFGDKPNYSYISCINSNFYSVSRQLNTYLPNCNNFGDELSYSFISCVNSNFDRIDWELKTR